MAILELRTYKFSTPEAKEMYLERMEQIIPEIAQPKYNVATRAVFVNKANPLQLTTLLQYNQGGPDGTVNGFVGSPRFNEILEGLDRDAFLGIDADVVEEADFAPLR